MPQPTYATSLLKLFAQQKPVVDADGALFGRIEVDDRMTEGTGDRQFQAVIFDERTLGAGANVDIDLQTTVDLYGTAAGLVDVRVFAIQADAANGAAIRLSPSAASGWTALISSSGATDDPQLDVAAGSTCIPIYAPADGSYPVSGSNKSINVLNLDGAAAVTFTILVAGPKV